MKMCVIFCHFRWYKVRQIEINWRLTWNLRLVYLLEVMVHSRRINLVVVQLRLSKLRNHRKRYKTNKLKIKRKQLCSDMCLRSIAQFSFSWNRSKEFELFPFPSRLKISKRARVYVHSACTNVWHLLRYACYNIWKVEGEEGKRVVASDYREIW